MENYSPYYCLHAVKENYSQYYCLHAVKENYSQYYCLHAVKEMKTFDDIRPLEASLDMFKEAKLCQQMTKKIPFRNRKLLLEKITNNERKAMEERQMEENEIKEGHEDVGEKQNNKAEETPIANRKLLLEKIINNERNKKIEEEPLEEIEIKKGHEDVEEEQDKEKMKLFRIMVLGNIKVERQEEVQEEQDKESALKRLHLILKLLIDFDMGIDRFARCFLERKTKLDKILENWLKTEGKSADAVDFLRNYQPLPPKEAMSKKKRNMKHHGMLPMSVQTGRYVVQGGAQKERGKLIENPELSGKFDDAEQDIQELEQLLRCKVCLDSDACIVFLPCRHMATCEYCEGFLHHCPVCRSFIEEALKINEE